jgi:hypothetical protein
MDMTDWFENKVGDHMLRNQAYTPPATLYLAIFTTATTDAGGGTEAVGGSYARQPVVLSAFAAGASANTATITFSNLAAGTYGWGAIMDALVAGNMMLHGAAPTPKTIAAGGSITVAVGDVDVVFS